MDAGDARCPADGRLAARTQRNAEIETLAFYARADLLPSDVQALRQVYQTLWQGMKPLRKAYLTLYRAVVPLKMRNFTQS